MQLEPKTAYRRLSVDTPSWCGGSLTTPPTVDDVDDEVAAVVRCLSVGVETLTVDEVEVVSVDCCTDGVETFTPDDVADRRVELVVIPSDEVVVVDVVCVTDLVAGVAKVVVDLSCHSWCISADDQC